MKSKKQYIFLAVSVTITVLLIAGIWLSFPKEQEKQDDLDIEIETTLETEETILETSAVAVAETEKEEEMPEIDLKQKAEEYDGEWQDLYSTRCYMIIEAVSDDKLSVIAEWGNSSSDTSHWEMTCQIDPKTGNAEYHDCTMRDIHYNENGTTEYQTQYVDGSGRIYIGDGGYLYWEDDVERISESCYFEKYDDSTEMTDIADEFILPESNSRYLTYDDLDGLDNASLRLARNEIYARHGRLFITEDLNSYFSSKSWYFGYISEEDFDDSIFNEYEKANLELIKSAEGIGLSPTLNWIGTYVAEDEQEITVSSADDSGIVLTFIGYSEEGPYTDTQLLAYANPDKTKVIYSEYYDGVIVQERIYTLTETGIQVETVPGGGWADGFYARR